MTSVFAKLSLRDYLRRRVCAISDSDWYEAPESSETTPLSPDPEEELVWYFVSTLARRYLFRRMAPIWTIRPFSGEDLRDP